MVDWILEALERAGALGVFALMLLENLFPPIPSELIMPLAGFHCANGTLHWAAVIAAGTLGSVVGALPWYYAGRTFGKSRIEWLARRHGMWLAVDVEDVNRAHGWFEYRGWITVLLGRLIPLIRTLISVPAGLIRMRLPLFLALTSIGSLIWVVGLTAAGYVLQDQYERVEQWVSPVSKVVVAGLLITYAYRLIAGFAKRSALQE